MRHETDLNRYVSKEIAAERMGLSVRRVMELAEEGMIRRRRVHDPKTGRKPSVLLLADIERYMERSLPFALMQQTLPPAGENESDAPPSAAQWLTIAAAAEYSGLPESYLDYLVRGGLIEHIDVGVRLGGRFRISRPVLERFAEKGYLPSALPRAL